MGLGVGAFTVGQAALKVASNKVAKHEKACSDSQHFYTFGFLLQSSKGHAPQCHNS